jgi:hypothetical protein
MKDLTLCITNWRRSKYLDRCLASAHQAGFVNVVVSCSEPEPETPRILEKYQKLFGSGLRVSISETDRTCHGEWLNAAYHSETERLIILHDDDIVRPEFAKAYNTLIKPALDQDARIASWRAHLLFDDGSVRATEYFNGTTSMYPSSELDKIVGTNGRLSLSPVVSVMNRAILIGALKEFSECINDPRCLYRPGMNLGTEILAYLRHLGNGKAKDWFFCAEVLSMYGSHDGSGTVDAQKRNDLAPLVAGYDVAREHYRNNRNRVPKNDPKLLLVYSDYTASDEAEQIRLDNAMHSWRFHFDSGDVLDFPVRQEDLPRTSKDIGDTKSMPFINDVIDFGMRYARPEDVVCYINRDVSLTTKAVQRILQAVWNNKGAAVSFRRNIDRPEPGRLYHTVRNYPPDGGFDLFCFTPKWWYEHRKKLPDMYLGREGWDAVMRNLIEEVVSGKQVSSLRNDYWNNPVYLDDVTWHTEHASFWQQNRHTNPSQIHNRTAAKEFFHKRGNNSIVKALEAPAPRKKLIEMNGFKR